MSKKEKNTSSVKVLGTANTFKYNVETDAIIDGNSVQQLIFVKEYKGERKTMMDYTWYGKDENGNVAKRGIRVSGHGEYGIPTLAEYSVYSALQRLFIQQKTVRGVCELKYDDYDDEYLTINFNITELAKEMGYASTPSKTTRDKLKKSIEILLATTLFSTHEGGLYDIREKKYIKTNLINGFINGKKINAPIELNSKCINAAFFAVLFAPNDANIAVTQVPILQPNITGNAKRISIAPVVARATKIPVVADELCTTAVIPRPAIKPKILLSATTITNSLNQLASAIGFMASDITPIPINKIPNPKAILAISLTLFFLAISIIIAPAPINNGAIASKSKDTIWAVIVVPILAPIITPVAWNKFINPAFTKLTTITVVALELCIIAVTNAPTKTPMYLLLVNFSSIDFRPSPAAFSRPSPISFMPYKNKPSPPIKPVKIANLSINYSPYNLNNFNC